MYSAVHGENIPATWKFLPPQYSRSFRKWKKTRKRPRLEREVQRVKATQLRWRWFMESTAQDWRALSEAASREQDPEKLMELVDQLNRALLQRELQARHRLSAN